MTARGLSQDSLTIDQAAARFGISRRSLERLRTKGALPGTRVGRFLQIRIVDIEKALAIQDPEKLYRVQLHPPTPTNLRQWMRGWEQLVFLNSSDSRERNAALRWIAAIIEAREDVSIEKLCVSDVLEPSADIKATPRLRLLIDALRGLDPKLPMIKVLRQLLPMFIPKIKKP